MKKIFGAFLICGIMCAFTLSAEACKSKKVEAYAHPTMFGSQVQDTVTADANYVVGSKRLKNDKQITVAGKENVLLDTWVKDLLLDMKNKQGLKDSFFDPQMPVLRSELAFFLARGLNLKPAKDAKYTDITKEYWAKNAIDRVTAEGVMIGYPSEVFKPDQPITKAEVFATVAQLINVNVDNSTVLPSFKGYEMKEIPTWAVPPTKEVLASGLLEMVPAPDKVASEEYLSKEQVAYLIGNLRKYIAANFDSSVLGKTAQKCTSILLDVKMNERVSARHSNVNDTFTASLVKDTNINGTTFVAGSTVKGQVVEVVRPGVKNPGYIKVKFTQIKDKATSTVVEFPKNLSEAIAENSKNPNVVARIFGAPFSASARVVGVAGRSASTIGNIAANSLEEYGDNLAGTFVNTLSLKPLRGVVCFGKSFVTIGKGIYNVGKTVVSGTFGILYEFTDEIKYVILPSASNDSALNPNEELTIIY